MRPPDTTAAWSREERETFAARRRSRNLALGLLLGALVALFFGITVVRMAGQPLQVPGTARTMPVPAASGASR